MSRPRLAALLLALATLAVYLPVMRNGFVNLDDADYITENPVVQAGWTWPGVKWAFTTGAANNWHPLTWLSHMTDCQFFKLDPAAHHFVSALIHALNSALVFLLLFRLIGKFWPALFIAALFAWHPLHVESVAWAAERKDVLCAFFWLLALLAYVKFYDLSRVKSPKSKIFYSAALLAFFCALLAKPMAVTLPFVLLLLDFWPLARVQGSIFTLRGWLPLLVEKIPFFILTAASCLVTYLVQANDYHGHTGVVSLSGFHLDLWLGNPPLAVAGYLAHFFWPANLCVFYPLPRVFVLSHVAVAVLIVAAITVLAWRWRGTRPYFLTGWLWFLGTLIPVIGIIQVGAQSMADRYTYLPSIGFFLAVVLLAAEGAEKIRLPKIVPGVLAVMVCAACIFATERQIRTWRDSETLFRHAIGVADSDTARMALGSALLKQNRPGEAADEFQAGIAINPKHAEMYNNLAVAFGLLNRPADALAAFRSAIKLVPNDASQHTGAGYELGRLGRDNEALAELAIATNLAPFYALPHIRAARILYKLGRDPEGAAEMLAAAQLKPNDWQLLTDTAYYLAADENPAARNGTAAVQLAKRADELTVGQAPFVTDTLAMAFAETGDFDDAVAAEQHAISTAVALHVGNVGPLQQRLELFQNHQPWRESFTATNTAH